MRLGKIDQNKSSLGVPWLPGFWVQGMRTKNFLHSSSNFNEIPFHRRHEKSPSKESPNKKNPKLKNRA